LRRPARRWTAWHEEWKQDVGCLAVETDDGLVLVDPLAVPPEVGEPAHVLVTVFFHARDAGRVGGRVWAPKRLERRLRNRGVTVTDAFELGDPLPGGLQAFASGRDGEVVYWLPEQRAVAVGDVLLGGPLRLCPKRWLAGATQDDVKAALRPLLELPVEQVLVAHGDPVLTDGHAALAAVLA
jgi:glyoxylase-like metal-dependent hydrolase (beta-lactamase superfamily II)